MPIWRTIFETIVAAGRPLLTAAILIGLVGCTSPTRATSTSRPTLPVSPTASAAARTATSAPPTATRVPPTAVPTATPVPPTPTTAPRPTAPPTPDATAQTTGQTLYVANTDGIGVYIRSTPNPEDKLKVWLDDTPMVVVGPDRQISGTDWKNIRDPDGDVGWVPAQYLTTRNPAATNAQVEANSPLVFTDQPRFTPKAGGGQVEGIVKNSGSDTRSAILRALLVDSSGNPVAIANGVVNDVPPGQSRVYVLFVTQNPPGIKQIVPQVVLSRPATEPPQIVIQNVAIKPGPTGPTVVGQVHNADSDSYSIALVAGFVQNGGALAGTARGTVDALAPGQTRSFTLRPDNRVSAYSQVVVQVAAAAQASDNQT